MTAAVTGTPTLYQASSASSAVIPVPAGVQAGDLLVASVAHLSGAPVAGETPSGYSSGYGGGFATATTTTPAGWTLAGHAESTTTSVAVFYRYAGTEPGIYTFPTAPGAAVTGRMVRVAGVDPGTPLDGSVVASSSGTPTTSQLQLGAIATGSPGDVLLSAYSMGATSGVTVVAPPEMVLIGTPATTGVKSELAVETRTDAGDTGPRTWGSTGGGTTQYGRVGVILAARAAAVTSTTVSTTQSTSWRTLAQTQTTRTTSWAVASASGKTRVGITITTSWAIATAGQTVSTTRSTGWRTLARAAVTRTTSWAVVGPVTTAVVRPTMRLRVFAPAGVDLGLLPTPESVSASFVLGDVGALAFTYAPRAPKAALLGQPCEVAVEISPDSGRTWVEPRNGRFVYVADGRDPVKTDDRFAVDAKSYVWRLSTAKVLPNGLLNNDGKRAFLSATPGVVLQTLLNEAQSRGALTGITHGTFSTGYDSSGAPWEQRLTIYYEPGIDYLAVLMNLSDQGFCEFAMDGRELKVYNPDGVLAQHRDTGTNPVTFRRGRDLTEAPFRRTWEGLANYAYFAGDQGTSYEYTNPAAATPWGRQETFIANGSVSDIGTMATLTQAALAQTDRERVEYTHGLDFARAASAPLWDYQVGDYALSSVDTTTVPVSLRIHQLTLTNSAQNIMGGNVVLNDRFVEADIRAKRRVDGITNGASGAAPLPGSAAAGTDKVAPAKVTGLVGSSVAYLGPGGYAQSQVSLSWGAVTTSVDGTPAEDIDHYEVSRRLFGSLTTDLRQFRSTTDTGVTDSPYQPGANWWFSVRAVDQSGNRGDLSSEVGVGMARDITPPQAPSAPVVTPRLGLLSIVWDGQPETGTWPLDFDHVEVHASTSNNFTPTAGTLTDTLFSAGTSIDTGRPYGVQVFYRLIAVDKSGLKSLPSAQGFGTPARLVGSDIDDNAITYQQIGFKDQGNVIPDGSFETPEFRVSMAAASSTAWQFSSADQYHGNWSASVNGATGAGTDRQLVLVGAAAEQQIMPAEKLFLRMAYRCDPGTTGTFRLIATWYRADQTLISTSALLATAKNGSWQQIAGQVTAPAGTFTFRVAAQLQADGTSGVNRVDAVEVRRVVGTAIIADAAIGNAQIANLAVNNAKVADLDVGKLTAGILSADILVASRIRTATTGNRLELSTVGMRMYRGTSLTGSWDPALGQLRIYSTTDLSHTSAGHGFQCGDDNDQNLAFDNNEIMSRFNGDYSGLLLNREGGNIALGGKKGGFASDYSDAGVFPATDDHAVQIRASVEIANNSYGEANDLWAPLIVGPRGNPHMWMDRISIGAANGSGGTAIMHLNPPRNLGSGATTNHTVPVYIGSDSIQIRRIGDTQAGVFCIDAGVSLQFVNGQVNARDSGPVGNRSMGASAFNVLSERHKKKNITDITDPMTLLRRTKSRRWKYRDEVEEADNWHFGPMAEDLPADLQIPYGDQGTGYDVVSLVGILWEGTRRALLRADTMDAQLTDLVPGYTPTGGT